MVKKVWILKVFMLKVKMKEDKIHFLFDAIFKKGKNVIQTAK